MKKMKIVCEHHATNLGRMILTVKHAKGEAIAFFGRFACLTDNLK